MKINIFLKIIWDNDLFVEVVTKLLCNIYIMYIEKKFKKIQMFRNLRQLTYYEIRYISFINVYALNLTLNSTYLH